MRLTTKSEYGLLAVIDLACQPESTLTAAREIAERRNIPVKFLEQIMTSLRQAGLVASVRGAHGGFALGRSASEISVLDVVEAVDGPLVATVCETEHATAGGCSKHSACAAASVWSRATHVLREEFSRTSIHQLAECQKHMDETLV